MKTEDEIKNLLANALRTGGFENNLASVGFSDNGDMYIHDVGQVFTISVQELTAVSGAADPIAEAEVFMNGLKHNSRI